MKKLLLGSISLFLFSLSILVFQISCKDEAIADIQDYILPPATTSSLGGVIVGGGLNIAENGVISASTNEINQQGKFIYYRLNTATNTKEIWTADYSGGNPQKLDINLPAGYKINNIGLTPDGTLLIFNAWNSGRGNIYTCKTDGTNLSKIIEGEDLGTEGIQFLVAF